ncbi:flavodoxin domain-containing protein [Aeromicrobium sp.]|uniref:flavodoxin domain-containing protein n=1 Tax=Aeromicrobium sp. TaxID=1871063 RepID=UPI003C3F7A2F
MAVAAASRHGGTCEIADRIAVTLAAELSDGWSVTRTDLRDLRALDDVDAVVLGSAVYYSHWMHAAGRALRYVKDAPLLDLWLFSTGPISEVDSADAQVPSADAMVADGLAVEHQVFGGRLDTSLLNWAERAAVKAVHALPGDHRDWDQVDDWAKHIAAQLSQVPTRGSVARSSGR